MSKGHGGSLRSGGGGLTQGALNSGGISGNAKSIAEAWQANFGQPIGGVGDIYALAGINKSDLGKFGEVSVRADKYTGISVTVNAPGLQMRRGFRDGVANHDALFIAKEMQGRGLGSRMLRTATEKYQQLGIKKINLEAAETGRYAWPSMGFRVSRESLAKYASGYRAFASERGLSAPAKIRSVQQIARSPGGKEFLLSKHAPDHQEMSIRTARLARELKKR